MGKPLTQDQLTYLRFLCGLGPRGGSARGLVARSLLRHRWGSSASYGYIVTPAGEKAAEAGL